MWIINFFSVSFFCKIRQIGILYYSNSIFWRFPLYRVQCKYQLFIDQANPLNTTSGGCGSWTRSFKLSAQVIVQILSQVQYFKPFDADKQNNHKKRSHFKKVGAPSLPSPNSEDIHHAKWNYWGLSASWGPIYRGNRQMSVTASPSPFGLRRATRKSLWWLTINLLGFITEWVSVVGQFNQSTRAGARWQ